MKANTYIFLDDERNPNDVTWLPEVEYQALFVVRNFQTFKDLIDHVEDFSQTIISFDHDLQDFDKNGNESTGYDCLKHLCDRILSIKSIPLAVQYHTQNVVGKTNMSSYYSNFLKHSGLV